MVLRDVRDDPLLGLMVREGVRIAAMLVFWVAVSGVGVWLKYASSTGSLFIDVGLALTRIAIIAGLASVLLYVLARGLALARSETFERAD